MAKRKRNPDGSLVTPLSPRQQEALAKGRATLAARYAGQGAAPAADEGAEPRDKGAGGSSAASRVQVVRRVSKAPAKRAKARAGSSGSKARTPARTKETAAETKAPGVVERIAGWLSST